MSRKVASASYKKAKKINIKEKIKDFLKKKEYVLFCIILLIQIAVMVYFGGLKKGYFVDELWSYGLANSYYHPHIYSDGALSNWVSGDYFKNYLEVLEEQRFSYDSVIYNQINDYHPPLFYLVLHTICSIFPNSFSKWYAIIPNIFYFSICMILLYKIGEILFDNSYQALMPVIAYGLCAGSISNVIYIRMYVLLTVWVLFTFYIHSKWIKTEYVNLKELILLMIVSYLGFMSHYYFFIFAFLISAYYIVYLVIRKRIKEIVPYSIAMGGSLLLVLITFPTAFQKLFFDKRGEEAVENLLNFETLSEGIKSFSTIMIEGTLANCKIILYVGLIAGILLIGKRIISKSKENVPQLYIMIMAILIVLIYFLFVAKIAPYRVDRYVFCIYPLVLLMLTYLFFRVLQEFKLPVMVCQAIVWVLFLFLMVKGMKENRIQYIYPETAPNIDLAKAHSGEDCIYVTDNDGAYLLVGNALELQHMGYVLVLPPDYLSLLPKIVDPSADEMVVYVDERYNPDEIMTQFCQNSDFETYEPLFVSRCYAYVVNK